MTTSARTPHPHLALILATVGLVVFLGAVGTVSYLLGFTGYLPLAAGFLPLAAAVTIGLTLRRSWRATGFRPVHIKRRGAPAAILLVVALPIVVISCSSGLAASGVRIVESAGLAVLVGFVEETIFRGVLLRAFASRGTVVAIVATSIGFAVAHSAAALSPDQSLAASLGTVGFAFLFGVIAALLVRITDSIWPAIALHATFDFAGFVLTPRSSGVTDLATIAVAAALAVTLVLISRRPVSLRRADYCADLENLTSGNDQSVGKSNEAAAAQWLSKNPNVADRLTIGTHEPIPHP